MTLDSSPQPRSAGVLIPLFSFPSSNSWGIGEITDIAPMTRWLSAGGQRLLQLLPINEMPLHETSPYSALSAMAVDPQFLALGAMEDFAAVGGESRLSGALQAQLDVVRASPTIRYAEIRELKQVALRRSFSHFQQREWASATRRAAAFKAFIQDQAWWLEDYALFRALHARHHERPWMKWPQPVRDRDAGALEAAREELAEDILYRQYLQWVAADQWADARDAASEVALYGDLPFMVSADSADVWTRQEQFRLDASVGVPPDAFSETGQDWGLPAYRWDVIAQGDFEWLRARARRNADLFDGFRIDHLVGFYRTYFRLEGQTEGQFVPATEPEQLALGEQVLGVLREGGVVIAEDLGTVPDFVRESLARLQVPGFKVFRWERDWNSDTQPFREPADYAPLSVATSGTHDTESMTVWWERAPQEEREAILAIPSIASKLSADDVATAVAGNGGLPHTLHEALLESLYASGSNWLILPFQDVFGWRDRINQPATVNNANWRWRLPWPVERLALEPPALSVSVQLAEWSRRHHR